MNAGEFKRFSDHLPNSYKQRFSRLGTFDKLSNHKGLLEYEDFELVLDVFAEMVVDDEDIEFSINKVSRTNSTSSKDSSFPVFFADQEQHDSSHGLNDLSQLTRFESWRRHKSRKRDSQSTDRELIILTRQPTHRKKFSFLRDMSWLDDENNGGTLTPISPLLSPENAKGILPKHKSKGHINTVSELRRISNIDDVELDDEEINNYMKQSSYSSNVDPRAQPNDDGI